MQPRLGPDGEDELERVLRARAPDTGTPDVGQCLDENTLSRLVSGSLSGHARPFVEAHLALCGECREVAGLLASVQTAPTSKVAAPRPGPSSSTRRRWPWLAAAAVLIAGALLWPFLPKAGPDTGARLMQVAVALERASPELFTRFRPLDDNELAATSARVLRGQHGTARPVGKILDARPRLSWTSPGGVASWTVTLQTADGQPVWREPSGSTDLEYPAQRPPLEPGRSYLLSATGRNLLGEVEVLGTFTLATEEEEKAFSAACRAVTAHVPEDLRELMIAHLALRRELIEPAAEAARIAVQRAPEDELARMTWRHVSGRLGEPR